MKFKTSFLINKTEIDMLQTLSCGQIFSWRQMPDGFVVQTGDKIAKIKENRAAYEIFTNDKDFFISFFDLKTDYHQIKSTLLQYEVMKQPIIFGGGIRILRQDLLEVIVSFVISANNNIKRISTSVEYLRKNFGEKIGDYHAFPTLQQLAKITESDFRKAGAGYRSPQLIKLIAQLADVDFYDWGGLKTDELKARLVALSGIGPKVADCIMLFGYGKTDVFPVDTWIEKVYNNFFAPCHDRKEIRRILVDKFQTFAGYAQQYLFYYQRSFGK